MRSPEQTLERPEADVEQAEEGRPTFSALRLVALVGFIAAVGLWQGWRLLAVIGSIVVIIFLHELGHYVMARRAGMKVTEFFLGFGPRIWSFRRGEVEYGIKAIPAGAYVRIIGMMNIDDVPEEDEPRTYRQQGFWDRIGVAVAGSTMHFIIAIVLSFIALVAIGENRSSAWTITSPTEGSAASLAGLKSGDRVVSVAGVKVNTFDQMSKQVRNHPDSKVRVGVIHDGHRTIRTVTLGAKASIIGTVGEDLDLGVYRGVIRLNSVQPGLVLDKAGLADNDVVTAINGVTLTRASDVARAAKAAKDGRLAVTYQHGSSTVARQTTVDLGTAVKAVKPSGFLGVGANAGRVHVGPIHAVTTTFSQFGHIVAGTVTGLGRILNPSHLANFAHNTVSGTNGSVVSKPTPAQTTQKANLTAAENRPVSIIGIVGLGKQLTDWGAFLEFLAAVNITLGLINLIPLLPFDGGHVAVACYERIRELIRHDRRRYFVDAAKLMPAFYVVILALAGLMLLTGYADIVHPIQL
jgi:RIP metalloprotease RseP